MEDTKLLEAIEKLTEKNSKPSVLTNWILGVSSGLFITIISAGFFMGVNGISHNNDRILTSESEIKNLKESNLTLQELITKLIDGTNKLSLAFNSFNSIPRFGAEHSKEAIKNNNEAVLKPRLDNIVREIKYLRDKQEKSSELMYEVKELKNRIDLLDMVIERKKQNGK